MDAMLFSPIRIRKVMLRNRIVVAPMVTYAAVGGHVNDWHTMHYGKFAAGGAGLVFMESTKVDPRGCTSPRDMGLWKDDYIEPLRRITDLIKSSGAVAGIQLSHGGRKARNSVPWEGRSPLDLDKCPGVDHGEDWELIAPSAVPHAQGYPTPREMTRADIEQIVDAWGQAAARADRAGFDVVEVHAAHGYLIHQFLSPTANRRTDEYGGSPENRMRFAVEVARRIRQSWPQDKPLFFRVSAIDEEGRTIEESIALATTLKANGVDVIDCSTGGMTAAPGSPQGGRYDLALPYGYQVDHARRIKASADMMTMAVGMIIHADQAEDILRTGRADLIALGREFLHNPNWPLDAAQKLAIQSPFAYVPPAYGYWLEKRASNPSIKPSTWQRGIDSRSD